MPEDLFYRVQQRMEKNKRAPAHSKAKESEFLLTTKLFCGKCERMMVGESGKSHTGAMHYYYKCGNAKRKKGCNKKAVKKDWIERAIVRLTMERVLNEEKINRIIDALLAMQEREDVTIPALRRQLAETEKGIENMLNAIQQGIFTASTKQRLEELEKQKEELSLSMTTAELQKPKLTREYMEHWFSQFRYGDPNDREFQKRLIDTFVNAIFVYDDKLGADLIAIKHGTQTITLKEVEDFLGFGFGWSVSTKREARRRSCLSFLLVFASTTQVRKTDLTGRSCPRFPTHTIIPRCKSAPRKAGALLLIHAFWSSSGSGLRRGAISRLYTRRRNSTLRVRENSSAMGKAHHTASRPWMRDRRKATGSSTPSCRTREVSRESTPCPGPGTPRSTRCRSRRTRS